MKVLQALWLSQPINSVDDAVWMASSRIQATRLATSATWRRTLVAWLELDMAGSALNRHVISTFSRPASEGNER